MGWPLPSYLAIVPTLLTLTLLPALGQAQEEIRGLVKAKHEAVLSADHRARLIETPVHTGESFNKDDLLLRFDCEAQLAESAALSAALQAAKARHESNLEMKRYGALGRLDAVLTEAQMKEAEARLQAIQARTKTCEIHAPYAGKVVELLVNAHETVGAEQPLLKIVGDRQLELRLIVPSNWLIWLKPGHSFSFAVDETGQQHQAEVARIGAEVNAVSRTVLIIANFAKPPKGLLPGMSGTAHFKAPPGQTLDRTPSNG